MADAQKPLTPSAIKYLLTLLELCQKDAGARCMDIAEQLRVTKPSVHSMIENLCAAGLAEKKKYGTVFLTPEGRMQAERYAVCCSLVRRMGSFFSGMLAYRSMDLFTLLHSTTPLAQRLSSTALVMPWASISFWVRSPLPIS